MRYSRLLSAQILTAQVYNCRSPSTWPSDLALTATHLPEPGLTFGLLFGSSVATERDILKRLGSISFEAAHPMLLPGLFTELELVRHKNLIDINTSEVETKIYELNTRSVTVLDREETELQYQARREAYLNSEFLRKMLTTWNNQLLHMVEHVNSLHNASSRFSSDNPLQGLDLEPTKQVSTFEFESDITSKSDKMSLSNKARHRRNMYNIGCKIKNRLVQIRDEYDEKIRDCTMRNEGFAVVTQWVCSSAILFIDHLYAFLTPIGT
jgi:hypothetical protein